MDRITPEQVIKAAKKLNLRPVQKIDFGDNCACGLVIVARATGYMPHIWPFSSLSKRYNIDNHMTACVSLGLDHFYSIGFVNGWDGVPEGHVYPGDYLYEIYYDGFNDGKAAWNACVDVGLAF